jgi:hypothetical protein
MIELRIERGYVTASVAAKIEGCSRQAINQRLNAGRVPGAFLMDCGDGRELWVVPRNSLKDKRNKESKHANSKRS